MPKLKLSDLPVLARFVEKLIDWMYPHQDNAGTNVSEYVIADATVGYSSREWEKREFSGTVAIRLSRPEEANLSFQVGCLANTNHGMFAVVIGPDGFVSEIEMHFYTRQAPPFIEEIIVPGISGAKDEARIEMLEDARNAGFFDIDDFFRSLVDRPLSTILMEE